MASHPRAGAPSVIVIMTDQQKATASHLYGNSFCRTPALERLADRGVLFEHAVTPHPLCVPARVSFWTGQYPHQHGARRNETLMPAGAVHAAALWHDAGLHVGLIGKNHCFTTPADLARFQTWCELSHRGRTEQPPRGMPWCRPAPGIDAAHAARDTLQPQNPRFGYAITDHPLDDYSTGLVAAQTERFLAENGKDPFALWVSFPDPHEPWVAPAHYVEPYLPGGAHPVQLPPWRDDELKGAEVPERTRVLERMLGVRGDPEQQLLELMAVYYGMVSFIDDAVARVIDAVDALGLSDYTIIVFCSDHGDFMGEHAMQCKGGVFYDCLTRVPLIVAAPDGPRGVRDASMVNLVDVVPTLLTLQGLAVPRSMAGQPLPQLTAAAPREAAFAEYGAGGPPFRMNDLDRLAQPHGRQTLIESLRWREAEGRRKMVRTARWKWVHDPLGDCDELYDLQSDPWELTNLAADPAYAEVKTQMTLRLADWSVRTEDARPVPLP